MKATSYIMGSTLALLSLLASCGKKDEPSRAAPATTQESAPQNEETHHESLPTDGSNIQGYYLATFTTLNPHINGTLPGSATFYRKEDRLFVFLRLFAGQPKAWHQQKVYTGTRCPTMADDKNGDGHIDIVEAEEVVGKVLIPLDADLSTQYGGRNFYPVGDLSGSYHYERVVSFTRFLNDLKGEDRDPDDNIIKLAADEPFVIEGKVVMVQGTSDKVEYPETVASTGRYRPFQTLPIACGVFKKNDLTPGSPYDETIPGPIADVEDGQDRPAPDEDTIPGETGGTVGGGSNDSETDTETQDENGNRHGGGRETTDETEDDEIGGSSGNSSGGSSGGANDTGPETSGLPF